MPRDQRRLRPGARGAVRGGGAGRAARAGRDRAAGRAASSRRTPTSTSSCCTIATRRARSRSPTGCCTRCGTRSSRSATRSASRARPRASRSDDLATATALLDARHIAGDRRLTTELVRATLGALAPGGNPNDFIAMLAAEKKAPPRAVRRLDLPARAEPQAGHRRAARPRDGAVGGAGALASAAPRRGSARPPSR